MVDYNEAFKQGLEAAKAADRARKEIDSVFDDLNQQLDKLTNGMISIKRREHEVELELPWDIPDAALLRKQKKKYCAIVAYNPSIPEKSETTLAIWKQDRTGYPCKITWEKTEHICEDKEALENTLAELLRDPAVGEKLEALLKFEATVSEE